MMLALVVVGIDKLDIIYVKRFVIVGEHNDFYQLAVLDQLVLEEEEGQPITKL